MQTILKGAARVLVTVGYDRANTGLIAQAAGVSVGSLYQYFPHKAAVFARLLQEELEGAMVAFGEALGPLADARFDVQIRASIGALLAYKGRNPRLHRVLKTELGGLDGTRLLKRLTERTLALTEQLLLAHKGEFPLEDPQRVAFLLVNMVEGIIGATLLEAPSTLAEPVLADEISAMVMAVVSMHSARARANAARRHGRLSI